ncbi:hypothetical protein [Crystallibacter degradans]|uniref:hypothetical protein n=1 Tax=Crystallibacter degradans TaxID=2726743 RepID=UPI001474FBD5|nr:hypothetical protein [Arthrobacter sp. SF27]NMR31199.1 hypothetical protein [Arthrobacter sp. SF27]
MLLALVAAPLCSFQTSPDVSFASSYQPVSQSDAQIPAGAPDYAAACDQGNDTEKATSGVGAVALGTAPAGLAGAPDPSARRAVVQPGPAVVPGLKPTGILRL